MSVNGRLWPRASVEPSTAMFAATALLLPLLAVWAIWMQPLGELNASRIALAGRDFTALWAAGRIALEHAANMLSSPTWYTAWLRHNFGEGMPDQIWPYPPTTLLLAVPVATLSLPVALAAYSFASFAVLWLALRTAGFTTLPTFLICLSPAALNCALAGQNGLLLAASLVAGFATIRSDPRGAGAWLALSTLKPQFALLLPVALVAGQHWRVLGALMIWVALLIAGSILLFGLAPWASYLSTGQAAISHYIAAPWIGSASQRIFTSAFMASRALGADLSWALLLQASLSVLCAVLLWNVWQRPGGSCEHRIALTLALILLGAPWAHSYDEVGLSCSIVLMANRLPRIQRPVLALAWMLPGMIVSPPPVVIQFGAILAVAGVAWAGLHRPSSRVDAGAS